jgi:hypothetical protein
MSENSGVFFCEGCPMAGNATGAIVKVIRLPMQRRIGKYTERYGNYGAVIDENSERSEIIKVPINWDDDKFMREIETCEAPLVEEKGFWVFKWDKVTCPTIGKLACDNFEIENFIKKDLV